MTKFGPNNKREATAPQAATPSTEEGMQRVGEALDKEYLSRRAVAKNLGISKDELRRQMDRNTDLRLSQLYAWHRVITDVPLGELLPEEHQPDTNYTFDESAVTERVAIINAIKSLKAIITVLDPSNDMYSENTMELKVMSERLSESLQPLARRLQIEKENRPTADNGVELSGDSLHRINFYLDKHPQRQSALFKAAATKLGVSQEIAKEHIHPGSDLFLSELYVWATVLDEPVMNLLVQSDPFEKRSTTLFLTKRKGIEGFLAQARTFQKNLKAHASLKGDIDPWQSSKDVVRQEAADMLKVIDTIFDLDGNDISPWPRQGQKRTMTEESHREQNMLSAALLPDHEPRD